MVYKISILFIVIALGLLFFMLKPANKSGEVTIKRLQVIVTQPQAVEKKDVLEAVGTVSYSNSVNQYANNDGIVDTVLVSQGSVVKAGDPLIKFSSQGLQDLQQQLMALQYQAQDIQNDIDVKKIELKNLQNSYTVNQELYKIGTVSKKGVDDSLLVIKTQNIAIQRQLQALNAVNLAIAKKNFEVKNYHFYVYASTDGIVSQINAKTLMTVPKGTPLVVISQYPLVIQTYIEEQNVQFIQVGNEVQMALPYGDEIVGKISNIGTEAVTAVSDKAEQGTVGPPIAYIPVTINLMDASQTALLKPNYTIKLSIEKNTLGDASKFYTIPKQSVESDENGQEFVWILNAQNVVEKYPLVDPTDYNANSIKVTQIDPQIRIVMYSSRKVSGGEELMSNDIKEETSMTQVIQKTVSNETLYLNSNQQ